MPELIIDPHAGFCPGVKKTINGALNYAGQRTRVFSFGELIHNPQVLKQLTDAGVQNIGELSHLSADSHLIIRAHGIPPETELSLQKQHILYLDLTCSIVKQLQKTILRYKCQGYRIYIIGKKDHPEVRGLLGYAGAMGTVIPDAPSAKSIKPGARSVVLAQTTTSLALFQEIREILKEKNPGLESKNTICKFVLQRQQWIQEQAPHCDAALIVGGKQSSNTAQLYHIAAATGPAFWIENHSEAGELDLAAYARLALSAGTSTPPEEVSAVSKRLQELYGFSCSLNC